MCSTKSFRLSSDVAGPTEAAARLHPVEIGLDRENFGMIS
jgi:hypothetical protein